jgi:nucleotide-binding universal stress UspA family protein
MTIQTLLIPTDGSDRATAAARRGFDLATQLEATVRVLSVADSSIATGAGYSGDSASIRERLRETAAERAESLRADAEERGLKATAAVREGIPANEIVDDADERADVVVMGTAGRGTVARAVVGSVADKVVRTASVPVVTVTPDAASVDERTRTVDGLLLPTDGSDTAEAVARQGLELAAQLEATVHLLTVVDDDLVEIRSLLGEDDDSGELVTRASEHHTELVAAGRERGLEVVTETTNGDPAEEIVDYADREGIGLIAMGTAGRGGFKRFVVGSVADAVVRTAPVPVLTDRPNGTNE